MHASSLIFTSLGLLALSPAAAAMQFGAQADVATTGTPLDLGLLDIDGDGDLDIAAAQTGAVTTVENLGFGDFGLPQALPALSTFTSYVSIEIVDLDSDGRDDIVVADATRNQITWFRSLGASAFELEAVLVAVQNPEGFRMVDFDLDGDLDIIATRESFSDDELWSFENLGDEIFASEVVITTLVNDPTDVALGDFDGDGVLDLASTSFVDDKTSWYRGLGNGAYGPQQLISTGTDGANRLEAADFNGDGLDDLVVVSFNDDEVSVFQSTGSGFSNAQLIDNGADEAIRVSVADLDRDGDLDIVVGCRRSDEVRTYDNIGFGFFGVPVPLDGFKNGAIAVVVGDVDGDADVDVVSGASARIYANFQELDLGTTYCPGTPNSTGGPALLTVAGTTNLDFNELALTVTDMPPASFGFFITSQTQGVVVMPGGSEGTLCVLGNIGRYVGPGQPQFSGINQRIRLRIDPSVLPTPTGSVSAMTGQQWNFQAWYRDSNAGVPTSNFSSAVATMF